MTAMNYLHVSNGIAIWTDTLVTAIFENGVSRPYTFRSKVYPLHVSNILVAFKGNAQIFDDWARILQTNILFKDIEELNSYTPICLREIAKSALQLLPSKIYHFGFHDDEYCVFCYASENDWNSEKLPFASSVSPMFTAACDDKHCAQLLMDAVEQKKVPEFLELQQSLGGDCSVGGHMMQYTINQTGIGILQIGEYKNFVDDWNVACEATLRK